MRKVMATKARNDFFEILKRANQQHQIFRIEHRKGNVVLMSEDEYESLIETLELLSIPGFVDSMKRSIGQMNKGETVPFEDVFRDSE